VPLKAMLANALSPLKSITAPLPAISSMTKSERILQNVRSRKVLVNSDTIIKSKTALVKPKLAIGRTGSATREKKIKEAIELEKQPRIGLKNRQIIEQADEVKSIMQTLDSRGSTLPKRY
jgi:hypothetical protein